MFQNQQRGCRDQGKAIQGQPYIVRPWSPESLSQMSCTLFLTRNAGQRIEIALDFPG